MSDERRSDASAWAPPGSVPEPATDEQPAVAPDDAAAAYEPALVEPDPLDEPAGDEPASVEEAAAALSSTPVVPDAETSFAHAPAGALPAGAAERPELLAGAAFAGGLVAALILKRLVD